MFKVGDKVRCISMKRFPPKLLTSEDRRSGGYGYGEGLVFTVPDITPCYDTAILWGGKGGGGVYSFAVEHVPQAEDVLTKEEFKRLKKLNPCLR
mgnify:CR=1 FL=1